MATTTSQRIRAAYLKKGLNRSQFARLIDVAYSTVLYWEKRGGAPNDANLRAIASALGVSAGELVGEDDSRPESRLELEDEPESLKSWREAVGSRHPLYTDEIGNRMRRRGFRFPPEMWAQWDTVFALELAEDRGKLVKPGGTAKLNADAAEAVAKYNPKKLGPKKVRR